MNNKRTNMNSDQNQYNLLYTDLRRRIKKLQEHLRELPDNELMRLHMEFYEQPENERDAALLVAFHKEVERRHIAAGWLWRRLFRRQEFEKWVAHNKIIEAKAIQDAINLLQKYDDPSSQEAIRRLTHL